MSIPKKVREEAIEICLASATGVVDQESHGLGREWLGHSDDAEVLAFRAWWAIKYRGGLVDYAWIDYEAAALLRDGWCPGDPVHSKESR